MSKSKLTQARVKELFDYDSETGDLIRKVSIRKAKKGNIAGCQIPRGYLQTSIDNKMYYNHRLVWLYHHGFIPESGLDHINRVTSDNRIENLREASQKCNMQNRKINKNNKSGIKGISMIKLTGKWYASITVDSKTQNLGFYDDFIDAVAARLAGEQALNWSDCDSSSPAAKYMQKYSKRCK